MSWKCIVCTLAVGLLVGTAAADPIVVTFDAPTTYINVGDSGTVDIVADIPADSPVLGWGLDVNFDPAIVALTNVMVDMPWTQVSGDGDGLGGIVFPTGIYGQVTLATLTFDAIGAGISGLDVSVTMGDLNEGFALDPIGFGDWYSVAGEIITPEPASLTLLALAGLLIRRR